MRLLVASSLLLTAFAAAVVPAASAAASAADCVGDLCVEKSGECKACYSVKYQDTRLYASGEYYDGQGGSCSYIGVVDNHALSVLVYRSCPNGTGGSCDRLYVNGEFVADNQNC